jgi:hypothetical protein
MKEKLSTFQQLLFQHTNSGLTESVVCIIRGANVEM